MEKHPESILQFINGYISSFAKASREDYNTFTMVIFAVLASAAFGVFKGLAYATGLYAILHFWSGAINGICQGLNHIGVSLSDKNNDG